MKRQLSIIAFIIFAIVGNSLGEPYDYGETVPIMFVVPDSSDGEPLSPDLIFISVYYASGTTPVVSETGMSNWNGRTGEYYYNFTAPDSGGVYNPRLRWKAQGREYILWLDNVYVAEIFDVNNDTLMVDVTSISGDDAAADNLEYFLDGTGSANGVQLSCERLAIENDDGDAAFYVHNTGGTAVKYYSSHTATGEDWSYGLAVLSGSGNTAPARFIGGGTYNGIRTNIAGTLSVAREVVDSIDARANILSISDDTLPAVNLKYFLDGTGDSMGVELAAEQLKIKGDFAAEGAFHVENSGGNAAWFKTSSGIEAAAGLYLHGDGINDNLYGLHIYGDNSSGDALGDWNGKITVDALNASGDTLAIKPAHWSVSDSAAYQGEASGLTAGDVWGYTGRTVEGGWVDSNKTEEGATSGAGQYARSVIAIDSASLTPVSGVRVSIRSIDQSALAGYDVTDILGQANFNLDADSFIIIANAPGYNFNAYDTIGVTGSGTDSIYGSHFDPGSPADPDLCRVYGYIYSIIADPENGAVIKARLPDGVRRYNGSVISPLVQETQSDSTGYFYLDLIPSTLMSPDSSTYEISITLADGTILREKVVVPDLSSWQLTW